MGSRLLDTGVVIAWLNAEDAHHESVMGHLLSREADGPFRVSAVTYAELRTAPGKRRQQAIDAWLALVGESAIVPVGAEIAEVAGHLRSKRKSLRLADALIAGTALVTGVDELLTTDRALARLEGVTYVGA